MNEKERAVMQQALEALYEETAWFGPTPKGAAAITALRAALAQQAEPVRERVMTITTVPITVPRVLTDADLDAIRALLPEQAEPAQEPVGWMNPANGECISMARREAWERDYGLGGKGNAARFTVALGPIRAQRQPLTDEEIRAHADKHLRYQPQSYEASGVFDLARAIERKVRGETE